jgi:hypothetical protein
VLYWVREIRAGREDLSNEAKPGRPCQINLDTVLAHKLELDPNTTTQKLALSLGVSAQTVTNHLHHNLGMKCYHLRWISHGVDNSQKAERVRLARIMLEALNVHVRTNYQYLITGDELEMMYDQIPLKMLTLDRDHIDTILRPSHQSRKTMITVFFGVNGISLVKILSESMKLPSEYFKDQVLREIYQGLHGSWWPGRLTHLTLHYDDAPVHNSRGVSERLF